jgi:hypothetical protein
MAEAQLVISALCLAMFDWKTIHISFVHGLQLFPLAFYQSVNNRIRDQF